MSDMIQSALSWLDSKLAAHAATECMLYLKAGGSRALNATLGPLRRSVETFDGEGVSMTYTFLSFDFSAEDAGFDLVLPAIGDEIALDGTRYQVRTPAENAPHYEWLDAGKVRIRVWGQIIPEV